MEKHTLQNLPVDLLSGNYNEFDDRFTWLLTLEEDTMLFILSELYGKTEEADFAGFHPRFLLDQVCSISHFEGVTPELRPEFLRRAWANLFTDE